MIITKSKPFPELLQSLKREKTIFLVGCSECATVCKTGGEEEVRAMRDRLEEEGKVVSGWVILDPGCNLLEARKEFRKTKEEIGQADSLVVMSCGGGAQIAQEASGKVVHPTNNTLFLGTVKRFGQFQEYCSMCGECILDLTGGLCPVTRCPKGLLNGPCGGAKDEKCEVNPDNDCVWIEIYDRLKEIGRLKEFLASSVQVHDYSVNTNPSALVLERDKARSDNR